MNMRRSITTLRDASPRLIGERYELLDELARGGMGVVHRARDRATARDVALKLLRPDRCRAHRAIELFEREYRVLSSLRHPRIIEVFGYGIDVEGPYYTMELLEGLDLHALAPLGWRAACQHLRDVAASLALLHARRLLHRDVSARNVRLGADGRAKLLDFGALCSPGPQPNLIGTPVYLAPEALTGKPLDARTDLYSLGAVAYWLLTRTHAFTARRFDDLPAAWTTPPPPLRDAQPDIPEALDALVMSLLHPDPLARPASAAEVMDRLDAIAALSPDVEAEAWQSYLRRPALVGRDREVERLRLRLTQGMAGSGCGVLITAPQGAGRTRLLEDIATEAEVRGAAVLRVEAEAHPAPYGTAKALAEELLRAAPAQAARTARFQARILVHAFPFLASIVGDHTPATLSQDPAEQRSRLQQAILEWLLEVARHRPLVVCVDDAHRADEASMALLAALARKAPTASIVLLMSARFGERASSPDLFPALREASLEMRLRALDPKDTHRLMQALFGDVPYTARLASALYLRTGGNPQQCIEIARAMVRRDIVRYAQGTWVLPQNLQERDMPAGFREALASYLIGLSPDARDLAQCLSVQRRAYRLDDCIAAAGADDPRHANALLTKLVQREVLTEMDGNYRFRQEPLRQMLFAGLGDARRREVHRRLGEHGLRVADRHDAAAMVEAGWHLLRAGQERRGADVLAHAAIELWKRAENFGSVALAFEAALDVYERHRRPPRMVQHMLTTLTLSGWYVDRRLADRHGERCTTMLCDLTGVTRARRLRPTVGKSLAITLGIGAAAMAHSFKRSQVISPRKRFDDLFVNLISTTAARVGVGAVCIDPAAIERTLEQVEPLSYFGDDHVASIMYRYCRSMLHLTRGEEGRAREDALAVLERLEQPRWSQVLQEEGHRGLLSGLLLNLGTLETFRDVGAGLVHAQRLEDLGMSFYRGPVAQLRMLHHVHRGEMDLARHFREQVELHSVQGGATWQTELFTAVSLNRAYQASRDLIGLKHTLRTLERWADEVPSIQPYVCAARGAYEFERGEVDISVAQYERALERIPVCGRAGWADIRAFYARSLRAQGRPEAALRVCREAIERASNEDKLYVVHHLEAHRQLALAECDMGDAIAASERLELLIEEHRACGPLTRGGLHLARAVVALRAQDRSAFDYHARRAAALFRPTGNSALAGRLERLMAAGSRTFGPTGQAIPEFPRGPRRGAPSVESGPTLVVSAG
jgi:tetratricopeptide (TPR) repeat protein